MLGLSRTRSEVQPLICSSRFHVYLQVPTIWSFVGAVLICSTTLLLGVFERKKKEDPAASHAKQDMAAAREDGYSQLPGGRQ